MVQTTGGLTDFSEETLVKIQASCLEGRNASQSQNSKIWGG